MAVIEVGRDTAFRLNSVGLERRPFPLSFSVREAEGSWLVRATAARAGELTDLLTRGANDEVAVVKLATGSFLDEDGQQWRPGPIAKDQDVDCTVHRLGRWAAGSLALSEEFLLMHRSDLPRFLDGGWSPYELSLVGMPAGTTPEQLDGIALVIGTALGHEPLLPHLEGSHLCFHGHDDCYLTVESRDPATPSLLFGRLLALLAGSALVDAGRVPSVHVPEPEGALPQLLLAQHPHWIGTVRSASECAVTIGLTALAQPWLLAHRVPERAEYLATLDAVAGRWTLAPAAP